MIWAMVLISGAGLALLINMNLRDRNRAYSRSTEKAKASIDQTLDDHETRLSALEHKKQ